MMRKTQTAMICLLMLSAFSFAETVKAKKNLVVNGSFEMGPEVTPERGFLSIDEKSDAIKGWVVTRGQIDLIAGYWKSADGKRSLDLNGSPGIGGVKQTIETTKGTKYRLTFKMAGNPVFGKMKELTVEAGETKKSFTFDNTDKTTDDLGWVEKELVFTASGEKTVIELYSTTTDNNECGPALDDVRVVEVK